MSILADFLSKPNHIEESYYDDLETISLENDYLEMGDLYLDIYKYKSSIEQLCNIDEGVCNLYMTMESMKESSNNDTFTLQSIGCGINTIIEPLGIEYELPSIESGSPYLEEHKLEIAIEGAGDVLRKIKEFIIKLYNGFINAIKKFWNWLKGLFGKTKSNAEKTEKAIEILKALPAPQKKITSQVIPKAITKAEAEPKGPDYQDIHDKKTPKFKFTSEVEKGKETDMRHWELSVNNTQSLADGLIKTMPIWETPSFSKSNKLYMDAYSNLKKLTDNSKISDSFSEMIEVMVSSFSEQSKAVSIKPNNTDVKEGIVEEIYYPILGNGKIVNKVVKNLNLEKKEGKTGYSTFRSKTLPSLGWKWERTEHEADIRIVVLSEPDMISFCKMIGDLCTYIKNFNIEKQMEPAENMLEGNKNKTENMLNEAIKRHDGDFSVTDQAKYLSDLYFKYIQVGVSSQINILKGYLPVVNKIFSLMTKAASDTQ